MDDQIPYTYTAEEMREQMPTDRELADYPPFHDKAARKKILQMAEELGIHPPPVIIEMPTMLERYNTTSMAFQSAEGTNYIAFDSSVSGADAVIIASHELGHPLHGDGTPEHKAEQLNRIARGASL